MLTHTRLALAMYDKHAAMFLARLEAAGTPDECFAALYAERQARNMIREAYSLDLDIPRDGIERMDLDLIRHTVEREDAENR